MTEITNNVLQERIEGVKSLIGEKFDENFRDHDSIKARLDYTNGSIKYHDKILWGIGGGLTIISILVVPVLIFVVNNYWGITAKKANAEVEINQEQIKTIITQTLKEVQKDK